MTHSIPAPVIPTDLATMAATTSDPCDVAEHAMPDLILGDLAPVDADWVHDHAATCGYCNNILTGLQSVCSELDACDERLDPMSATSLPQTASCLGMTEARFGFMDTPVGEVLVASSDDGVVEISYLRSTDRRESLREIERRGFLVRERQQAVQPVIDQLDAYFTHGLKAFRVPVDLTGVTDFTRSVLEATSAIPYGHVQTYGDIAASIGRPKASRAVGNALGRNPVPVIIPCHRVILASGAMGWYTGGPDIKRVLLGIEGAPAARGQASAQASLLLDA